MKIKKQFQLFFTAFILCVIILTGLIGIHFLNEAYGLFRNAENRAIAAIMAEKMLLKAVISFTGVVIFAAIVSIPVGLYLSRLISKPYLKIFEALSNIALKRLKLNQSVDLDDDERAILEKYMNVLISDYETLRDYEKSKSWKDGARLLMHEIKNPMTPLKISAQKLSLSLSQELSQSYREEIQSILTATVDMEKILSYFKKLVNIEFGPKEKFDFKTFFDEYAKSPFFRDNGLNVSLALENRLAVLSEKTLLRMLLTNLINNGLESNPNGFDMTVKEENNCLRMDFITFDRKIENISRIFRPGFSEKGSGRGYGLFICKLISDYLDANLSVANTGNDVVFKLKLNASVISA